MKKILVIAFILFVISVLSCAPKNSAVTYPDSDPRFAGQLIDAAESADAYFWRPTIYGPLFYYYDKSTSESGVLCSDPNCDHTEPEKCLGSAQGTGCPSLTIIGDRLFWIATRQKQDKSYVYSIYSMRTDSTDRRIEHDLELPNNTNPQIILIHGDSIYIYSLFDTVESGVPINDVSLLRVPLYGGEATTITRFENPASETLDVKVRAMGDSLYYLFSKRYEDGAESNVIFRYDTVSRVFESVYSDNGEAIRDFAADENGCLYVSYVARDGRPARVCRIEKGSPALLFDFSEGDRYSRYVRLSDGIAIGESYDDYAQTPTLWIRRLDGSTLFYGKLSDSFMKLIRGTVTDINAIAVCGDEKYIFISFEPIISNLDLYEWPAFFIRYEITENGLIETLLCSAPPVSIGG